VPEQLAIMRVIEPRQGRFAASVASARREIDLLREYRTRLTADVVTGKLDIRDAAARLANEVDEPELLDELDLEEAGEPELDDPEHLEA
jgi:type I restriction enzyme S subunit